MQNRVGASALQRAAEVPLKVVGCQGPPRAGSVFLPATAQYASTPLGPPSCCDAVAWAAFLEDARRVEEDLLAVEAVRAAPVVRCREAEGHCPLSLDPARTI